ncbi:disks large-associated protein 4-like [Rhinopithecus roxellana]|uniref:disks large-associated protein 4-like n=1 Tax=Rhinopithecus roxellana TaxID=61622 RepID=UPI0012378E62|nr:disks large-associated protein 4-like [Rhinopithecus roxellana]
MKGLGDSRPRHLSDSLDPPHEPLFAGTDRNPYLLSPTEAFAREARFPGQNTLPGDGLFPLNNQLPPPSSTFPRIHYNSHFEVPEESPFPSHAQATKINRLPANLLDQFEKQLPIHRDGFSTLQFPRGEAKARGESPGRIRHLVHSVQRLFFTKAPSLEGTAGKVGGNGSKKGGMEDGKGRRAKSKERAKAGEPKRRSRSNISGWWSSDDNLDGEAGAFRSSGPASGLMTLGRQAERSQPRYFMHAYNTISGHMLKATKNNTTELTAPPPLPAPPATCPSLGVGTDTNYVKRGSWSTLTLSHAHEVCQKTSATLDKSLLKSKSCHQGLAYHYLQVPGGGGEWSTTLLSPRETDAAAEGPIPCRRMRSGSYIKAMGDEDSDESGGSPKPSPKTAARRQSYLRATQQSLGEQSNPRRSLDRLDSVDMLLPSKCPSWEEDYTPVSDSLNDSSCISQIFGQASLIPQLFGHEQQVREAELSDQYEAACESACSEAESTAAETLDLPLPSYFRSRSHSYLRAIQAGCSQEEDSVSLQSLSPPPSTGSLSNSRTLPKHASRSSWNRFGEAVREAESPILGHAHADVGARSFPGPAGLGVGRTRRPARLRTSPAERAGPRAKGAGAPPPGPGVPGDARAADAGGGAGRGRRGSLTRRPRPSGVQNRSLGPGCVREEGECPPLAAAAASPSVTPSVCPVHVVAAASSARTPGARPAPPGAAAAPRGDGRRPRPARPGPAPPPPSCPSSALQPSEPPFLGDPILRDFPSERPEIFWGSP